MTTRNMLILLIIVLSICILVLASMFITSLYEVHQDESHGVSFVPAQKAEVHIEIIPSEDDLSVAEVNDSV